MLFDLDFLSSKRRLYMIGIGIILLVITGGYLFYQHEKKSIRLEKYSDMEAIAQIKTEQIEQWRKERRAEAEFFSSSPGFIAYTENLIDQDGITEIQKQ